MATPGVPGSPPACCSTPPGATALDADYYVHRIFGKAVAAANTTIREANAKLPAGALRAVELPAGTTSHDLRHHFASVVLAAGESVVAVAEWLGHDNATLVLQVYGHLMPQSKDRMRKAIDTAYGAGADSCAPTVPQRSAITP
jgi:integrase